MDFRSKELVKYFLPASYGHLFDSSYTPEVCVYALTGRSEWERFNSKITLVEDLQLEC